jgi:hypothetical protein
MLEALTNVFNETYSTMSGTIVAAFPKILATAIVLVVGLIAARTAKSLLHRLLAAMNFEKFSESTGMAGALSRADISHSASDILCTLVYWTLFVFTGLVALGTLGFATAASFSAVGSMIPTVVIVVAIMVLGLNVSAFISKLIQTAAVNAEIRQGRLVRNVSHFAMSSLVVVLALQQLGISNEILATGFLIFFGGACLAMALAFGLGSRDWAGKMVKARWKVEESESRNLSEASELGNEIFPGLAASNGKRKPSRANA